MDDEKFVALNQHGVRVAWGRSMPVLKAMLAENGQPGNTYQVYTSTGATLSVNQAVTVTENK